MIHRGTDTEAIKVAEKLGLTFDGMQEVYYQFTVAEGPEKAKGITFYVKDLSQVEARLHEKLKEFGIEAGNPGRVHFDRASIDSAIAAARRLKSDRNLYIFATHLGYTIDGRPPPGMQQYVIVRPDGTTETVKPSLGSNPKEPWTCPKCGRLNDYYSYPTLCSRCGYRHTPEAVPEVAPIQFPAQRRAMEKTLATVERLRKEARAGEIITLSWEQIVSYGWHPNTGRVYSVGGGIVADRMSGLRGRFIGDKIRPVGPLRGTDADPWIYFTRGDKKYRTPLYVDPTMSGSEKLLSRLKEPANSPKKPSGNPKEPWQMTKAEYVKSAREWRAENMPRLTGRALEDELEHVAAGHKLIVQNALAAGKPVPPEVLADYPDLAARYGPGEIRLGEGMVEIPLDASGRAISPEEGNPGEAVIVGIGSSVCDKYTGTCGRIIKIANDEVLIEPTIVRKEIDGYLEVREPPIRAKKENLVPNHIKRYEKVEKKAGNPMSGEEIDQIASKVAAKVLAEIKAEP